MQVITLFGILSVLGIFLGAFARPFENEEGKEQKSAEIYIHGNVHNTAFSEDSSKSQAASDRHGSEWNSTGLKNKFNHLQYDMDRKRMTIYAGGDAANLAIADKASAAQSSENDKKSGYNTQNLGIDSGADDDDEDEE